MDSYSDNNDYCPVRFPQWGDGVRLRSTLSTEWLIDAEGECGERAEGPTKHEENDQCEERPSYRRRRDAEDDGWRWRDASGDRGSVWERGATTAEASERPRREFVSTYLDESSVVRVTRRSSWRSEQASDDASRTFASAYTEDSDGARATGRGVWREGQLDAGEGASFEHASPYADDTSGFRMAQPSAWRDGQADDGEETPSIRGQRGRHGFSLVTDDSAQEDQHAERQGSRWSFVDDVPADDGVREAEQRASNLWGRRDDTQDRQPEPEQQAGSSWSRSGNAYSGDAHGDDVSPAEQSASVYQFHGSDSAWVDDDLLMSEQRLTGWQGRRDDACDDDEYAGQSTGAHRFYDSAAAGDDRHTAQPASGFQDTADAYADDSLEAELDPPTLRRHLPIDDAGGSYVADAAYADDADEPHGIWALVDAVCLVPETVGSFVLGIMGRMRAGGLVAIIVALLVAATLYNPVRNLYLANRRLDTLEKTYDAIAAQNEQLEHEIEVLQTREGIENEARAHGYVEPGETKVVVKGLPTENGTYTITDTELPDDRPWYIKALDALFGYNPES